MYSSMGVLEQERRRKRRRRRGKHPHLSLECPPSAAFESLCNHRATFCFPPPSAAPATPPNHHSLPPLVLPSLPPVIWNVPCISGGSCLSAEKGRRRGEWKWKEGGKGRRERKRESDSQLALLSLPECCSIYSSHCTQGLSLSLSLANTCTHPLTFMCTNTRTDTRTFASITKLYSVFYLRFGGCWE